MSNNTILIVEDDPGLQKQLKWALKTDFNVLVAKDAKQAAKLFDANSPAVVLHDLGLPPDERGTEEGKKSIRSILLKSGSVKVIVMTGQGGEHDAVELIALGAHDFFTKPLEIETLKTIIQRAFILNRLEDQDSSKSLDDSDEFLLPGVVGESIVMQSVAKVVKKVAKTSASVFINGESGTGKELIAQAIHRLSNRGSSPFIALNCAAIPENLLESELFGYEKGAFTGADKRTIGKIEQADGGTLFLDEIGDMAYHLQSKILRFLQERNIQRLGGKEEIAVDTRVISATHQDVLALIDSNQFRQDLYYRINEIQIDLPALRERKSDAVLIAGFLLEKYAKAHGKGELVFTQEAIDSIRSAPWEGNIRQLSNQINKAVILAESREIDEVDLGLQESLQGGDYLIDDDVTTPTLKSAKEKAEFDVIKRALERNNNNVTLSAKKLGVSRQRIYDLMKKYDLN